MLQRGTEADAGLLALPPLPRPPCFPAGHIGLVVPDVGAACRRFEELGVEFVKKPDEGKWRRGGLGREAARGAG